MLRRCITSRGDKISNQMIADKIQLRDSELLKTLRSTSGAIQRHVPVSAVIVSVCVSSLARPRSTSFTVLRSVVNSKLSATETRIRKSHSI